jgi:hypothetical protein
MTMATARSSESAALDEVLPNRLRAKDSELELSLLNWLLPLSDSNESYLSRLLSMRCPVIQAYPLASAPRFAGTPGRIREGYRPHPRHWQALAKLVGASGGTK